MDIKKLVRISLLCAISVVLVYFVRFSIIPSAPFLEYDPADISIIFIGLMYGTGWGLISTVIVSVIQGLTVSAASGIIGIMMHIISTGVCVSVVSILYHKTKSLFPALTFGAIAMVIIMVPVNLIFTGIFMGTGMQTVVKMLIPAIIPFNAIKAGINVIIAGLLFARIGKHIK